MNVSRSGYYKWLKNKNILNQYELNRKQLGEIKADGLEPFVREYFGFIDIVNNKNEMPFSKYTFV